MKRRILNMFLVCICYAVFFYPNTAFGDAIDDLNSWSGGHLERPQTDWEQGRIHPQQQQDDPYRRDNSWRDEQRAEQEAARKRDAFKLNEKGNQAYKAGNWKEAIDYYKKALRKSPPNAVWTTNLRLNLIAAQNALAEEETRKEERESRFKLNKKKGNQAYKAGNWKEAIDYYKKALRNSPNDRTLRRNLIAAQNALAKEETRKRDAFKLNEKGVRAYKAGNWKEAIDYYKKALRKFPNNMLIRQNLIIAQNALNKEGTLTLNSDKDPALAPGSPIGQEPTEQAQIRRIIEQAKYAHMDSRQLDLLARQYPKNENIQKSINSLKAKLEAMAKLESEMRKFNKNKNYQNVNEQQAKREVQRALGEVAALGIPAGDSLDEWLNKEKSTGEVSVKAGKEVITENMKDFVVEIFPKLDPASVTLDYVDKAKHLYKFYKAVNAAGDHYVNAAEASAYIKASESNGNILDKWSEMRTKALEDSARLYHLIQKEQSN